jgi:alginate O-acetyltransferase complex protein AlgJ
LYRRARKDPGYLAKKKVIVWCFAAREFTESDQGWDKVPVGQ